MSTGRATQRDLAVALGMSVATVSRALSDHPKISARTKARVLTAVVELGYRGRRVRLVKVPLLLLRRKLAKAAAVEGLRKSEDWRAGYRRAVEVMEDTAKLGIGEAGK